MAHAKIDKTNAARLLDRAGIAYELIPFRVDEEHLSAADVAAQLGEPVACVFKTLVLKGDQRGISSASSQATTRSISRPRRACRATRRST